jgi:hypothetical protein
LTDVACQQEGGKTNKTIDPTNRKERRCLMLRNKKWIIVTVLLATMVILVGVIGGMAYAATGTATSANTTAADPAKTLYARVAAILGIDQTKLEAAFTQAQNQLRDEQLTTQLKNMVDQGNITQAQADAYLKWWQSRPDVANQMGFGVGPGMRGGSNDIPGGHNGMQGPGGNAPSAPTTAATR